MLKIRLRRMGSRHRPFYRVVVSDSRRTPTSSALDEIGFYDPRRQPSFIELDLDRVDHWVSRGAQPSDTVRRLVNKARRATAPEAVEDSDSAVAEAAADETSADTPADDTPADDTPAAETAAAEVADTAEAESADGEGSEAAEAESSEPEASDAEAAADDKAADDEAEGEKSGD